MKLSKSGEEYYRHFYKARIIEAVEEARKTAMNTPTPTVPSEESFKRISAALTDPEANDRLIANALLERWKHLVNLRIEVFVEAYELEKKVFDEDDIKAFVTELDSESFSMEMDCRKNFKGKARIRSNSSIETIRRLRLYQSKTVPDLSSPADSLHDNLNSINSYAQVKLLSIMKKRELTKDTPKDTQTTIVIHGDMTGAMQVGGKKNRRRVTININPEFDKALNSLKTLIHNDTTLDESQKNAASSALEKLPKLAKKEQTEDVINRAKNKLEIFKSIISVSKDLASMAAPYLPAISQHFRLLL